LEGDGGGEEKPRGKYEGVGILSLHSHLNNMEVENLLRSSFFKRLKTSINKCWEPTEQCRLPAINAHSIQDKKVLELLTLDGKVIVPRERIEQKGEAFNLDFENIGHDEASTFYGLCSKHDSESNPQQLFLIAYRSVLKKLHTLSLEAVRMQKIHEDQVKVGRATTNPSDPVLNMVVACFTRAAGAHEYKRKLDNAYLNKHYKILTHKTFSIKHKMPTVAVSAFYFLGHRMLDNTHVPWVILNVFPKVDETSVIYSCTEEDEKIVSLEIKEILNSSPKRRTWLLSKAIIEATENFVVSPKFWNSLSKEKRQAIISFYQDTLLEGKDFKGDIRDLCLFQVSYKK
jgi:hypothetical protein